MHTDLGHRERVKERFRKEGLDYFDQTHALELMLFYAIPRQDTKPLARRLLDHFGSLANVLDADMISLQMVEGVGVNVATYLRLLSDVGRYYLINRNDTEVPLSDLDACGRYLVNFFHGMRNEAAYLLCLDAKCKLICCRKLGSGSPSTIQLTARQVVEIALYTGATSVVLAHNHPGGVAVPSVEDMTTTRKIARALATVDVVLSDHIVVADGEFTSMVHSGRFDPTPYLYPVP